MTFTLCSLPIEIRKCEYRNEKGYCLNEDCKCSFKESENNNNAQSLIKTEKWYKKYIR